MTDLYAPKNKERFADWRICILTPHADYESYAKFTKSLANMIAYSWMHDLQIEMICNTERMVVDWARNDLARVVRNSPSPYTGERYSHVLWLDDDMVFDPSLGVYLADEMDDYDMISGLYFGRSEPFPVVYTRHNIEAGDPYRHYPLLRVPSATFECDAVGFGAMLMRADVFDRVPEPWFTIDSRGGEDIVFCKHARDHGIRIACAGGYKLGHINKPSIVSASDSQRYIADHPELEKNFTAIQL